jgi:ABC-type transport system involved in cytochrome c biogenesis permease subunit
MPETTSLWLALVAYAAALALPWRVSASPARTMGRERVSLVLLGLGVALHTLSLATRWRALGHGPFTTLHEILSSNLWSLTLVFVIAAALLRAVRVALLAAWPVLAVLAAWMLFADASPGHLPPTYATPLLYLHTLVGKVYLGLLLVAVALGSVPWWRHTAWGARWAAHAPDERRLDELAHRFAAFAFVFDTLMLIVGAVWAQDAWGRYWAWDPLESWAFVSWLALATTLHARATLRLSPARHGRWLALVFVLAFLTFFGVPFVSMAPHKGAV